MRFFLDILRAYAKVACGMVRLCATQIVQRNRFILATLHAWQKGRSNFVRLGWVQRQQVALAKTLSGVEKFFCFFFLTSNCTYVRQEERDCTICDFLRWSLVYIKTFSMQVARVWSPVPARPTFSVEKLLFSVTLLRGTFSSTAIEIIKWVKNFAVAKVCWDFEVGLTEGTLYWL
jgi:hypothetical protein